MRKPVIITADSTVDLSPDLLKRYQIHTIPLTITLGDESFPDDESFTPFVMYERYHMDGTLPKTSAPGFQAFMDFFSGFTEQGFEVVHLDISAELSGTYNVAQMAAAELGGVYVIDSRMLSTGIGLLAVEAAECRDRGMCAADIAEHLNALKEKVSVSFVLDTLEFLKAGGRCSALAAFGANLLSLKPSIEVKSGTMGVGKKYRGKITAAYKQYITDRLKDRDDIDTKRIFITDSGIDESVRQELHALVASLQPFEEILHTQAGCTVSQHCGPGCMGILYYHK